ncbi:MAG: hypothetical protein ACXWP5_14395 [Bdellovibrionota bacterium]
MTRHRFGIVLVAIALLLVTTLYLERGIREGAHLSPPMPSHSPSVLLHTHSLVVHPYSFAPIQRAMNEHRIQLAACLMSNREISAPKIGLDLYWSATGVFERLESSPEIGEQAKRCIDELVSGWHIPPHPDLKPIFYHADLIPSIRGSGAK